LGRVNNCWNPEMFVEKNVECFQNRGSLSKRKERDFTECIKARQEKKEEGTCGFSTTGESEQTYPS